MGIGGDPCVEDEADETAYTFRMSVPSGSPLDNIEPAFKNLCVENGWDLIDDEVSFSKPRKGKTKFTMTIAVPKYHLQVQPATEAEVHQIVVQGFTYTESEMVIEFEGDRRIAGKKWLECENGIPQFVFEWTDYDSEHQQKAIRAWFGWNREHRTLQRRVENTDGTVHYWVITKWVCQRAWVIERWTEARFREGVRRVDRVVYIRRGLHEPREETCGTTAATTTDLEEYHRATTTTNPQGCVTSKCSISRPMKQLFTDLRTRNSIPELLLSVRAALRSAYVTGRYPGRESANAASAAVASTKLLECTTEHDIHVVEEASRQNDSSRPPTRSRRPNQGGFGIREVSGDQVGIHDGTDIELLTFMNYDMM